LAGREDLTKTITTTAPDGRSPTARSVSRQNSVQSGTNGHFQALSGA